MKKFFEKHDLFKLSGLFLIIAVILSWVVKASYYSGGELTTDVINRSGLFDISTYGMLSVYYFTTTFVFIFIVAGFYKFLSNIEGYKVLTDKIANAFNGKEKILVAISTLILACFSGVATDNMAVFALIPFVICILSKLKVDKITGLVSTFGGVLVGIIGSTFSTKIVGNLANSSTGLGVAYGYEILGEVIIFVIAYLLLLFFTYSRMNKVAKNSENYELLTDPFVADEVEEKKSKKKVVKKVSTLPMAILLIITFIVIILGYVGWSDAFGISVFTDFHTWLTEATLFDHAIYQYILGSSLSALGSWDLIIGCGFILLMTLIIKLVYHVSFDKLLDSFSEGFRIVGKSALIILTICTVLEISVIFPTVPAIVSAIMKLGTNIGTLFISALLTSIFTVDIQYACGLIGSLFATYSDVNAAALVFQAAYGIFAFIAPTSLILMFGLSFLDIKYKDYFKFIWKFMLALLVIVIAILSIIMYV